MNEGRQIGFQNGAIPPGASLDPIWEIIREERIRRQLTMEELAHRAGVASSTISRGERGYQVWLSKTRTIAQALDITIITIMGPQDAGGNIE